MTANPFIRVAAEIADRIVVMRDGEVVGERLPSQTNADEIIRIMVGRSLDALYEKPKANPRDENALEVLNLYSNGHFRDISFQLKAGEIVGLAGLVGSGRSSLAKALFGILAIDGGTVKVGGKVVAIKSSTDAIGNGIAYVPEDRQRQGLLMPAMSRSVRSWALRDSRWACFSGTCPGFQQAAR